MTVDGEPAPPRRVAKWLPIALFAAAVLSLPLFFASIATPACACSPTLPPLPRSPVVGVVISVQTTGLGDVIGVTLRQADGTIASLQLGGLENATEFPPAHLSEHQASSEPIRAHYRLVGPEDVPIVYRLEDA